jgi:hypothetical protein
MARHTYIDRVTKENGAEAAKELFLFQQNQVYAMKHAVERENLNCDAVLTRCFEVTLSQFQADETARAYEQLLEAGLDFVEDVDYNGPKYVETVSASASYPWSISYILKN